jgi:hypothetical protein
MTGIKDGKMTGEMESYGKVGKIVGGFDENGLC